LQDHVGAASGPALAVFPGFGLLTRRAFRGTASSNPGSGCAISASCCGTLGDILRPLSTSAAGIRFAAAFDNQPHCKLPAAVGTSRAEKTSHNSGNAVLPYGAFIASRKKAKNLEAKM
jgi:hypothetical protein